MVKSPFQPRYGATVTLATAAAAVNGNVPASASQLLITNDGTGIVFVRVKPAGNSADATTADLPVRAGATRVISKDGTNTDGSPNGQSVVSVFSPGGAVGNVYVTPGEGYGCP